jgi:hypothetical protein
MIRNHSFSLRKVLTHLPGFDNLSVYTFGKGIVDHKFCKTCGSSMFLDFIRHSDGSSAKNTFGVNVSRCLPRAPAPHAARCASARAGGHESRGRYS